jgi:phenylpropionate dioxygenase-like ring-hydroxylating dioxygenase large terminal subunit
MWQTVFAEDISVVEGMQKGRKAPAYDGGKFSAVMDESTYHFHKWVARELSV